MAILTPLFFVFRNYKEISGKVTALFFSTSRFQLYFSSFEKLLEYARFFQALRILHATLTGEKWKLSCSSRASLLFVIAALWAGIRLILPRFSLRNLQAHIFSGGLISTLVFSTWSFAWYDFISCPTTESSSLIPLNISMTSKTAQKDTGSSVSIPRGPLSARKLHLYSRSLAVNIRAKGSSSEKSILGDMTILQRNSK